MREGRKEPITYDEYLGMLHEGILNCVNKIDRSEIILVGAEHLRCKSKSCSACVLGRGAFEPLECCARLLNDAIDDHKTKALKEYPELFV